MNPWHLIPETCKCGGIAALRIISRTYGGTTVDMLQYHCPKCGRKSVPNNTEPGAANAWHRGDFESMEVDLFA